jgi:hypothetical protein
VECVRNHEVSGSECEERRDSGKIGSVKKDGGQGKEKESVTRRECKNLTYSSYVQLFCTVPNIKLLKLGPLHYS